MKKSAYQLDYCSDHLRALRQKLAEHRHGGIVLPSEQVEGIVNHLDEAIAMALNLEFAVSNDEWNRRAAEDRAKLMTPASVIVLDAFRSNPKVVPFTGKPRPRPLNPA